MVRFEWDERKAQLNLKKHGVSFEEATEVFFDPNAIVRFDTNHSIEEERMIIIGLSSRRLLFVVYVEREGDVIRIISARKATRKQRDDYGKKKD
jgi:hypothetical protein